MYGSLTGDGASFGQSSREGTELAVDEINTAGGVLGGRKFRLLVEDDQSKPEEASNAVTKLITQDKVAAVLGEVPGQGEQGPGDRLLGPARVDEHQRQERRPHVRPFVVAHHVPEQVGPPGRAAAVGWAGDRLPAPAVVGLAALVGAGYLLALRRLLQERPLGPKLKRAVQAARLVAR
jgi:hypothetical protein